MGISLFTLNYKTVEVFNSIRWRCFVVGKNKKRRTRQDKRPWYTLIMVVHTIPLHCFSFFFFLPHRQHSYPISPVSRSLPSLDLSPGNAPLFRESLESFSIIEKNKETKLNIYNCQFSRFSIFLVSPQFWGKGFLKRRREGIISHNSIIFQHVIKLPYKKISYLPNYFFLFSSISIIQTHIINMFTINVEITFFLKILIYNNIWLVES